MQGYIHNPPFGTRVPTMQNLPLPPPPLLLYLYPLHDSSFLFIHSFVIPSCHSSSLVPILHFISFSFVQFLVSVFFLFYPFFSFSSLFVFSLLSALSSLTLIPLRLSQLPPFFLSRFLFLSPYLYYVFHLPPFLSFSSLPSPTSSISSSSSSSFISSPLFSSLFFPPLSLVSLPYPIPSFVSFYLPPLPLPL